MIKSSGLALVSCIVYFIPLLVKYEKRQKRLVFSDAFAYILPGMILVILSHVAISLSNGRKKGRMVCSVLILEGKDDLGRRRGKRGKKSKKAKEEKGGRVYFI